MSLLTVADLAYMDTTQQEALPGTVVIERYTTTDDGMGGETETWAAVGTAIGRIYAQTKVSGAERVAGAEIQSITDWWGTFPIGTDIIASDRLFYGNRTWEVTETNNGEMWATALRCALKAFDEERRV